MLNVLDVAELILYHSKDDENMTHKKLQKLVYYAQGFSLALFNMPLFKETIRACPNGAFVLEIEKRYGEHSNERIPFQSHRKLEREPDEHIHQLIQDVCLIFKDYNAKDIERLLKTEEPWIKARTGLREYDEGKRAVIDLLELKNYIVNEYVELSIHPST